MAEKFFIANNKDSDDMYRQALLAAGYIEHPSPAGSDFIVHDAVHPGLEPFLANRPNFIVPHTPQSSFMWDGILGTSIKTNCNFVYGNAACKVLQSYDYPYRVETVGFSRCAVREFTPTTGTDLLIIPSHSLQHGEYTYPDYIERAVKVLKFILKHRASFDKITLCWDENRFDPQVMQDMLQAGFSIILTNPYRDPDPLKHMMERMEHADIVLTCGTAGAVACAMGKPVIFMTETMQARSAPMDALHSARYAHHLMFPLAIEEMGIEEVLAVRCEQNSKVEFWKQEMIGGPFNAGKFISVIREVVK